MFCKFTFVTFILAVSYQCFIFGMCLFVCCPSLCNFKVENPMKLGFGPYFWYPIGMISYTAFQLDRQLQNNLNMLKCSNKFAFICNHLNHSLWRLDCRKGELFALIFDGICYSMNISFNVFPTCLQLREVIVWWEECKALIFLASSVSFYLVFYLANWLSWQFRNASTVYSLFFQLFE